MFTTSNAMASMQERLQRKREPLDKWSIRELLCLSFAVAKVGDQNWMSVSRSLKPFGDSRPADWFHQKNCAAQYGALLENVDTPKRKKRSSGVDALESPIEIILKKLIKERKAEMKKLMEEEKAEYKRLQEEMALLKSGTLTEEQLDAMCKQIDEEERQKEEEAIAHAEWLKERENRKAELERAWRPMVKIPPQPIAGQKRKASESIDSLLQSNDSENDGSKSAPADSSTGATKPLSLLLSSLLKSPSSAQNVVATTMSHSTNTSSQRPGNTSANPTIVSLLNSTTTVQVSPGIQHLVSSAIAQDPRQQQQSTPPQSAPPASKDPIEDLLLNNADNLEDIENTILSVEGELPEIKNEEVDVIISDLIENADIVNDPETHLLDGDDIISNLESELEELDKEEKAEKAEKELEAKKEEQQQKQVEVKTPAVSKEPEVDPFEFQEDPEYEIKLSNRSTSNSVQTGATSSTTTEVPVDSPMAESTEDVETPVVEETEEDSNSNSTNVEESKKEEVSIKSAESSNNGSIEIVEVVVMEDEDTNKEQKEQVQDSGSSNDSTPAAVEVKTSEPSPVDITIPEEKIKEEVKEDEVKIEKDAEDTQASSSSQAEMEPPPEVKEEVIDEPEPVLRRDTFTPEYSDIFDENIEVTKLDKAGKAKRDYSRTKKKDEADFDILLPVETTEDDAESTSEQEEAKKVETSSSKAEEASHSPWTEVEHESEAEQSVEQEQEQETRPNTRRYSTPATPIDSVPNSPASSYIEDDREYRSLKKSLMLVYSRLCNHKYASLFHRPITNEQAPGYHKMVKRAMDLSTIKKNIESGVIRSTAEFKRDVLLMFHNAIMYNKTDDTVYKMTLEIQQEAIEQIRILQQAQADTPVPARRETRTSEGPAQKRKRESEGLQLKSKKRKDD